MSIGKSLEFPVLVVVAISTILLCMLIHKLLSSPNVERIKREKLEKELAQAQSVVNELEEKLVSLLENESEKKNSQKPVRIFFEGAFDMMHYGHMNAFRQAKALGTHLIVGVNSDATITACKGKPVTDDEERLAMVKGCRWVDEVIEGVPYVMDDKYIHDLMETYKIDFIVHGDDPCIVDGKDVYETSKKAGKFQTIPRTEGISTTDIVGRMLLMTKSHHNTDVDDENKSKLSEEPKNEAMEKLLSKRKNVNHYFNRRSNFLTTSRIIRLFSAGVQSPGPKDRIVYLAGAWDMLHAGHISILEKARKFGEYVIVGIHNDAVVNSKRGRNLPILNLHERVLSLLGCKYVNDVLFDAPYIITRELLSSLNISAVVKGTVDPTCEDQESEETSNIDTEDPYFIPREMGILHIVKSDKTMTVIDIVERIHDQRDRYKEKFSKKKGQEDEYYSNKYGFDAKVNSSELK